MLHSSTVATNLILKVNYQGQISARCEFKDHSASVDFFWRHYQTASSQIINETGYKELLKKCP